MDHLTRQAHIIAVEASHQLERELRQHKGASIALIMLVKARAECADALAALSIADPEKPDVIRSLQNEVRRFDDLVRWCREVVADGKSAEVDLEQEDADEMREIVDEEDGQ